MDPPTGPRHGGRHSRREPPDRADDPAGRAEEEPEFDPGGTVILRGEELRRWREQAPAPGAAPGADAANGVSSSAAAPLRNPPLTGWWAAEAQAGPDARPDETSALLDGLWGDTTVAGNAGGASGDGIDGPAGGMAGPRAGGTDRPDGAEGPPYTPGGGEPSSWWPDPRSRPAAGGERGAPAEGLPRALAVAAGFASAVGQRLAGIGRRGLESVQDLDDRVQRDPVRAERSALVIIGVTVVVVVLGIGALFLVAGTGQQSAPPAASPAGAASGTGAAGTNATPGAGTSANGSQTASAASPSPSVTVAPTPTIPAGAALRVLQSGMCLAVPDRSLDLGTQLVQRTCDGDLSEQFHLLPVAGRPRAFTLVDAFTGWCVGVSGDSGDDGAPVIQWDCNGQPSQQFELRDVPGLPGSVQLVAQHSGKCLDIDQASTSDGAPVRQWTCNAPDVAATLRNQTWQLIG